jgi:hypothetical protein
MEDSHSRNSSNTIATKLSKLVTATTVDINKAVHITNAEALNW